MTTDSGYAADLEEARFRAFLLGTESGLFEDSLFARCADAISGTRLGTAASLDVAVLLRQVIRRASERDGIDVTFEVASHLVPGTDWHQVHVRSARLPNSVVLHADPWLPDWLPDARQPPDISSGAGTRSGERAVYDQIPADPVFLDATGYSSYRTTGQRSAVRAALEMPPGDTLVALLPTGSGKTEVAMTAAHVTARQTTVIVVPTVALAYDFERRFRSVWERLRGGGAEDLPFAWTGDTEAAVRDELRAALIAGKLPFLVTSPESVNLALLTSLRSAAEGGRIGNFVVDEAHLVTQWGRDFRPEFRQLPILRDELQRITTSAGHPAFRTILLSATLGQEELEDLIRLFGPENVQLVAANSLRPEPEFWIASLVAPEERRARVLESLSALPRPLLLYVTSPDAAEDWVAEVRSAGYLRVATVTGRTAGSDRREVLAGLRAGASNRSSVDIVVATSAFGLGIDNDQIRSVLHVCLPETVDRWYQEVGRGGRDGHAATALLLAAEGDDYEAASLGVTMLKPDNAQKRWEAMWAGLHRRDDRAFVDLHATTGNVSTGSYNRRWNSQVLQGLQELGQIKRTMLSMGEANALQLPPNTVEDPHEWVGIDLERLDLLQPEFYAQDWLQWRAELLRMSSAGLNAVKRLLGRTPAVCSLLFDAYDPGPEVTHRFHEAASHVAPAPPCGRCPGCRTLGIVPVKEPPPRIRATWTPTTGPRPGVEALLRASPASKNLALLYVDDVEADAPGAATILASAGVRCFAGVTPDVSRSHRWYAEPADIEPDQLSPLATFVVPPLGDPVPQSWLVPELRPRLANGEPTPVVMLVRSRTLIGGKNQMVESLQSLSLSTAMGILETYLP